MDEEIQEFLKDINQAYKSHLKYCEGADVVRPFLLDIQTVTEVIYELTARSAFKSTPYPTVEPKVLGK